MQPAGFGLRGQTTDFCSYSPLAAGDRLTLVGSDGRVEPE